MEKVIRWFEDNWFILGALVVVALIVYFIATDEARSRYRETQAFITQSVQDDQTWSILVQGGGLDQDRAWHYEIVVPQNSDSAQLIAYYQGCIETRKQYPVKKVDTREVLEVLQTRGIAYKRVYIGERSSIEQSFHEAHPELEPDFDLQSRPKP